MICKSVGSSALKIHYLVKEPFSEFHIEELDQIIKTEIHHDIIWLPLLPEQIRQYKDELRKIKTESARSNDVLIDFVLIKSSFMKIQYKVILFGCSQGVSQVKGNILRMNEIHRIITSRLNSVDILQVNRSRLSLKIICRFLFSLNPY